MPPENYRKYCECHFSSHLHWKIKNKRLYRDTSIISACVVQSLICTHVCVSASKLCMHLQFVSHITVVLLIGHS